ncbi:MAG: hypothetical protein AMS25_09780 [Gemmatimonas sp. SM23_52]|nr:MAG: hypothetical protein AMS25_09780 [Gemmatimonas sp. SM23_52]
MLSHKRTFRFALALLAAGTVALTSCRRAAEITQEPIVSTDWVAEHLGRDELVLIHVGPPEGYQAGHLPGARYLDLQMISTAPEEGLTLEMPPVTELERTFEALGISDDSRVVVYFTGNWVAPAARVFLTLDYVGLGSRTSVMNGGLSAWMVEGRRVTTELPAVASGDLTPHLRTDVVTKADWVIAHREDPNVAILDARPAEYYTGASSRPDMRAGHIPGAHSLPFTSLVGPTLEFKDRETLSQTFLAAGVEPGDRVVSYCFIGQAASVVYLAARQLGYEASVYDGSFQEWSGRTDLPVAAPAAVAE